MSSAPRYPVAMLRRLKAPCPARVAGRVISHRSNAILVAELDATVWAVGASAPIGAWVSVGGTWTGTQLDGAQCIVGNTARGAFPRFGGDWQWFHEDGARRMTLLRQRALARKALREFFDQRQVMEVETPAMVPSPGLDIHLDAFPVGGETPPKWLITSPEYQMKRLIAAGAGSIYQICRCFRRSELGGHHEPEFTMVEWYRTFAGSEEVMRDTEQMVAHLASSLLGGATTIPAQGTPIDVSPPWTRITVAEAFKQYAGVELATVLHDEDTFYQLFAEKVQPRLGHPRPTFVTHWPASMASLARVYPQSPHLADRFEAFVAGIEICNGFGELIDPVEQRRRLEADQARRQASGKFSYPIDERFVGALEEGLPPCGGNALGLDRVLMLILGAANIQDVVAICHSRL